MHRTLASDVTLPTIEWNGNQFGHKGRADLPPPVPSPQWHMHIGHMGNLSLLTRDGT